MDDVEVIIDGTIGLIDFLGCVYMRFCIMSNTKNIQIIFNKIYEFREFCKDEDLIETEDKIRKFTKFIVLYCLMGNVVNLLIPVFNLENCRSTRSPDLIVHDPCGVLCRCYYPSDVSRFPGIIYVFILQFYTALVVTMSVLNITMLLIGVLIHATAQLRHCRKMLREIVDHPDVDEKLVHVIKYHIKITEFSHHMNKAFNQMMLIHVTATSCVISFLGFKIVTAENSTDPLRFFLHLAGWIVLVLIVCFCGQLLINESTNVARDAYFLPWYKLSTDNQKYIKMIIMRGQHPLQLSAASLGNMSFPTFLAVLKSAYSYFTLLLKIKG
ncbi:odorant receptor 4-like [Aethina tumida]|uniref:odorant receptor 4-like n=1 Tax=Aethina tumida TaxID=116153 RepID=UPI0021498A39|nr:odorant receptor 4-like [Aethina tumida]